LIKKVVTPKIQIQSKYNKYHLIQQNFCISMHSGGNPSINRRRGQ
jgi:hypothetical protein